jgi:hypothetical protein
MSKRNNPGCNCCGAECEHCIAPAHKEYLIETTGWINYGSPVVCEDCEDMNDTSYVVTHWPNLIYGNWCTFRWLNPNYPGTSDPCLLHSIYLFIKSTEIQVSFLFGAGGTYGHTFSEDIEAPVDCGFDEMALTENSSPTYPCNTYSASCLVTAI